MHVAYELIDVTFDDVLLLLKSLLRERMRQSSPLSGMIVIVSHGERCNSLDCFYTADVNGIFVLCLVSIR
jgi:hypothetical protein